MIRFVKFFGITLFFILLLTVASMYLSLIYEEGLVRPVALVFYILIFIGYALTLRYVWKREVQIEIEQARKEMEIAKVEAQRHREELEKLKKEFEEFRKKVEGDKK
ncbi:hypothetical protein GWK41_00830 [Persephonella atlantica]|uniref:Uncharacterized protein n=1 Tax=Persephonella atlantica TaxID=2699429 RepID=A0ABS1GFA2_9AQUI|nr:hypothetical protein [Persephonella atlantica]MBK3331605.1 hypothetical protein [Persephonella atlantica]